MRLSTKIWLVYGFIKWRLTWDKRNTKYRTPMPDNPKFMSAREAADLVEDGKVVALSGLGGAPRPSILFWALRERYEETQGPKDLTVMIAGGFGGRGRIPGTTEELGQRGLVTRLFTGHTETFKSMLKLADAGDLELQCLPQGLFLLLLGEMMEGRNHLVTDTGVGTFADPRTGRGSPVLPDSGAQQWVEVVEDPEREGGQLRYSLPKPDVALFNMPAADRKGNIYARRTAILAETLEIVKATKANGGICIANVAQLVEEGWGEVFLPAEDIDAVVVYPDTEQVAGVQHRKYWPHFTLESDMPLNEAVERMRFINKLVGVTPVRSPAEDALARLAATIFVENIPEGGTVDIGVGLPEEVSRLLSETGAMDHVTLFSESGVFGGMPSPGIYFGTAANPTEMVSSVEAFRRMYKHLDAAVLGLLQADSEGNVNVSYRGEGAINYVGPGGFIDITTCADLIVFCGSWMARGEIAVEGERVVVRKPGTPKFVQQVEEITFSGQEALQRGKKVFYVTQVGAFQLTERGMELVRVMPGVDVERDIVNACSMRVVLPEHEAVPIADASIVTGKGFKLNFANTA
jgi:propionate CoA-transferase